VALGLGLAAGGLGRVVEHVALQAEQVEGHRLVRPLVDDRRHRVKAPARRAARSAPPPFKGRAELALCRRASRTPSLQHVAGCQPKSLQARARLSAPSSRRIPAAAPRQPSLAPGTCTRAPAARTGPDHRPHLAQHARGARRSTTMRSHASSAGRRPARCSAPMRSDTSSATRCATSAQISAPPPPPSSAGLPARKQIEGASCGARACSAPRRRRCCSRHLGAWRMSARRSAPELAGRSGDEPGVKAGRPASVREHGSAARRARSAGPAPTQVAYPLPPTPYPPCYHRRGPARGAR